MEFDNSFEVPLPPEQAWPVLMNIQGITPCMPGAQLTEVVRRIRSLEGKLARPRTAVLMVTGRIAEADRSACFAAGADECVAKPYTPDELLDALDRALRGGALP